MSAKKLEAYLEKREVKAKILTFKNHTMTVRDAERQLGCSRRNIIKSMLLLDEKKNPVLAIVTGDRKVNEKKLTKVCGVQKINIARPSEIERLTGYEAGALPPVGHGKSIRTIIDSEVMTLKRVFGGGGAINALLEINPIAIKRLANAKVADISTP